MDRVQQRWIEKRHNEKGEPICLIPNCNNIAKKYKNGQYRNYCENHNGNHMRAFTNWQELQRKILRRDNDTCQICGDNKISRTIYRKDFFSGHIHEDTISNLEVDHIQEIKDGGDMWDENNLQTLCHKCHSKKTTNSRRLRRLGKTPGLNNVS